jgi:hypothetical protein
MHNEHSIRTLRLVVVWLLMHSAVAFHPHASLKPLARCLASNGSPEGGPEARPGLKGNPSSETSKRTVGRVSLPFTRKSLQAAEEKQGGSGPPSEGGGLPWVAIALASLLLTSSLFGDDKETGSYYYTATSVSVTSTRNADGTVSRNVDRKSTVKTNIAAETLKANPPRLLGESIWVDVMNGVY